MLAWRAGVEAKAEQGGRGGESEVELGQERIDAVGELGAGG
jgi:hypothetical protein